MNARPGADRRGRRVTEAALVFVVDRDRLLLQRRHREPNAGFWSPPGGKLHRGEAPRAAARRELLEETALDFGLERFEPRGTVLHEGPGPEESWRQHLFLVEARGVSASPPCVVPGEDPCRWFAIEEVLGGRVAMPSADAHYFPGVLDATRPAASWLVVHRPDGSVARAEASFENPGRDGGGGEPEATE